LEITEADASFFLAQHYVKNIGFDIKLYVAGTEVHAVAKRSPLHPEVRVNKHLIPVSAELRKLALYVGKVFGLDIYGLDIVETEHGPVVVDINDFPSFGYVPDAVSLVSDYILQLASHAKLQRSDRLKRMQRRCRTMIELTLQRLNASRALDLLDGHTLPNTNDIVSNELYADITSEETPSFR
jgi:hypothetical protein